MGLLSWFTGFNIVDNFIIFLNGRKALRYKVTSVILGRNPKIKML